MTRLQQVASSSNRGGKFLGIFRRPRLKELYDLTTSVYWRRELTGEELSRVLELDSRVRRWKKPEGRRKVRMAFWRIIHDRVWRRCLDDLLGNQKTPEAKGPPKAAGAEDPESFQ